MPHLDRSRDVQGYKTRRTRKRTKSSGRGKQAKRPVRMEHNPIMPFSLSPSCCPSDAPPGKASSASKKTSTPKISRPSKRLHAKPAPSTKRSFASRVAGGLASVFQQGSKPGSPSAPFKPITENPFDCQTPPSSEIWRFYNLVYQAAKIKKNSTADNCRSRTEDLKKQYDLIRRSYRMVCRERRATHRGCADRILEKLKRDDEIGYWK